MPDGLAAARALGMDLSKLDAFPFRGIRFCHGETRLEASFPDGTGLGIRRQVLHRAIVERARVAGVQFAWNSHIGGLTDLKCKWIVGADGGNSMVRRWAGLDAFERDTRRYGFRRHYRVAPWSDYMELHWGDRCQFYITPVSESEVCVVVISRNPHLRIDDALPKFPELAARLRSVHTADLERGSMTATRRLKNVWRENVALVGDASGSVDAITGEGLCLSFQQSAALAEAMAVGDLSHYGQQHRRIGRRPAFMADLMLIMNDRNMVRKAAIGVMAAQPWIFGGMLRMHVGAL
jgi:2-polyprenyl-6-methoxyphenol hydroxylase-like FAD-dependent oxidoreductase